MIHYRSSRFRCENVRKRLFWAAPALYSAGGSLADVIALRPVLPEGGFAQSETSVSSSMASSVVSPSGELKPLSRPLVGNELSPPDREVPLMSSVRRESSTELRLCRCWVSTSGSCCAQNLHCRLELPSFDELRGTGGHDIE